MIELKSSPEVVTSADAPARLQAALKERRAAAEAFFTALVRRGIREGDLAQSTNARRLGTYFMSVLEGMTIQARDGASPKDLDRIVDCAMGAWDGVVGAGKAARPRKAQPRRARRG